MGLAFCITLQADRVMPASTNLSLPSMFQALTDGFPMQVVDEFVRAVMGRWPNAVLQFEDFSMPNAHPLLNRYRDHHMVFNDDIQVSSHAAAVAAAWSANHHQPMVLNSIN